jgi:DNA-3-methyladenine glycosylase
MIPLSFYRNPDVVAVARSLIGKTLITNMDGKRTGGIIIETEAYAGATDRACHSYGNRRTPRTEIMYADGGVAYVYLCYGIHHLFNIVTGPQDSPTAVLIRALEPTIGLDVMLERRKRRPLAHGPGALTSALGITLRHNSHPLDSPTLWIEEGTQPTRIHAGPRIGVDYAGPDALLPYRFYVSPLLPKSRCLPKA